MSKVIMLKDVRLSFPDLFTPTQVDGEGPFKYRATALISLDNKAMLTKVKDAVQEVGREQWPDDWSDDDFRSDTVTIRAFLNGKKKKHLDGYEGCWFVGATNSRRPLVLDRDKTPLTKDDDRPYSGCYVNMQVEIWAQDNKYGKAINASLMGVQFVRDGDAFGGGRTASADDFDAMEGDEDGSWDDDEDDLLS